MGLDDNNYQLDKKGVTEAMGLIADSIEQSNDLAKSIRNVLDMIKSGKTSSEIEGILLDMRTDIDICNIYAKESRAKMISLTKNQLPF